MNKLEFCKWAHEHKDKIMSKMMNDEPVTNDDILQFLAVSKICEQNVMEAQRENVWEPVNDQLRQADGIHTVYLDDKSTFVKDLKGYDLNKAVAHALRHIDGMKATDPVRYNALMTEIKA